jgi:hypothetical protein
MPMQGCRLCRSVYDDESVVEWSILLKDLQQEDSHGCQWCQLFTDIAKLYEDRWLHLAEKGVDGVQYKVLRDFIKPSTAPKVLLQWPSINSQQQLQTSDIELEELLDEDNPEEIELEFATEQSIPEVSQPSIYMSWYLIQPGAHVVFSFRHLSIP